MSDRIEEIDTAMSLLGDSLCDCGRCDRSLTPERFAQIMTVLHDCRDLIEQSEALKDSL